MARTQRPLPFNLFFFFSALALFSISTPGFLVHSLRPHIPIPKNEHFHVLDVYASLKKTLQVFSNEKAQPTTVINTTSSSTLSFSLHPRDSIIKLKYESYFDLVTSRLEADSARSNFINSRFQRALSKSEHKTDIILPDDLETPLIPIGGGYVALVGVGQPVKKFHLLVDTGSDINWLQCKPCECFPQSDPIFNPSKSTSYRPLSCESQQCTALEYKNCTKSDTCIYVAAYGHNYISAGYFATETLSFGNSGSVDNVAIGCGRVSRGNFGGVAGILGLGGRVIALPSQIKATSFSYCLVDIDSSLYSTLEFNSTSAGDSVLVPLIKNPKLDVYYYYVELTGITIADELISIPASVYQIGNDGKGGIIVDSGTTWTYLETQVYTYVRDTFVKYTQNLTLSTGFNDLDTCYDISPESHVLIPTMSFQFSGGKTLSLPLENYFVPVTSGGKFCLAFATTDQIVSIIGNTQQQGFRVNYDLTNKLIGFSPNKC